MAPDRATTVYNLKNTRFHPLALATQTENLKTNERFVAKNLLFSEETMKSPTTKVATMEINVK